MQSKEQFKDNSSRQTTLGSTATVAVLTALASASCTLFGSLASAQVAGISDFHADPSARVFNGRLYIYPTHDLPNMTGWDEVDWHVFSTDDRVHYTDHGVILSLEDISWANKEAWAPDCIERDGKYYYYFPAGSQIGVAVGDSPEGPFRDALGKPLIERDEAGIHWCIDPCVFIDDDGQAYLYYGGAYKAAVVKLKKDMITRDGPIRRLEFPEYYEGVWVHKRNGVYYATYPTRPKGRAPSVMVYSMAKSPLGPWEYKGPLLDNERGNIHGSITEFKGQWYLFYHVSASKKTRERRICIAPLHYNEDGTIKPLTLDRNDE